MNPIAVLDCAFNNEGKSIYMTWRTFFSRPSTRYKITAASGGLILGSAGSFVLAFYIYSSCKNVTDYLFSTMDDTVNIPWLNAQITPFGYNATIELNNVVIKIPSDVIDMLEYAKSQESTFCFNIPFAVGLFITGMNVLSIINAIAIKEAYHSREDEVETLHHPLMNV